jgi:hypothetical protein
VVFLLALLEAFDKTAELAFKLFLAEMLVHDPYIYFY